MTPRCTLCHRRIDHAKHEIRCECGWVLDEGCHEGHQAWCPRHGEDRWIGAVERL